MVRGDFTMINENLISPTKRFEVASSSESIPELRTITESESPKNVILLDNTDVDDDDDEEDDDESEEEDDEDVVGNEGEIIHNEDVDADDDDDNDVNMMDTATTSGSTSTSRNNEKLTTKQEYENKQKVQEANNEREQLKKEKKATLVYKKKLLKEQKQHNKQMEFIANEQLSRERSQRLKSEKYSREIDKTNRDITQLQTMLKQLCQQRQSDLSKQAFYEKQVNL